MADDKLKTPVHVRAVSIKAASLPVGFSPAYQQYVLNQSMDFTQVAGKANQAAGGAHDAQVRNDEQDVILSEHDVRLDTAEATLANHETRITTAEATLANHEARITSVESNIANQGARLSTAESNISALQTSVTEIQGDYVSRSATASQSLASPLNIVTSLSIGATKVVGLRETGWTAATGTANKGAFNADLTFPVSATYTQSEIQAIATAQTDERKRIKAIEDALRAHGLIN